MDSNLIRRIAFAAVAIPLAVGLTWLGGWPLAVLVSLIAVLGVREFYDLASRQQIEAFRGLGLTLAAFIPLAVQAFLVIPRARLFLIDWWPALGTVVVLALLAAALLSRAADRRPLTAMAVTAFGVIYAAALPAFLLTIRSSVWSS